MSEMIPFGPVAPSAKPKFDPPDGFRYQTDGIQMQLSWPPLCKRHSMPSHRKRPS